MLAGLKHGIVKMVTFGYDTTESEASNRITIFTNTMAYFGIFMAIAVYNQLPIITISKYYLIAMTSCVTLSAFIVVLNYKKQLFYARLLALVIICALAWNAALTFGKTFNGHYQFFVAVIYSILAFSRSRTSVRVTLIALTCVNLVIEDWLTHQGIAPLTGLNSKDFPFPVLVSDTILLTGMMVIMVWVEKTMADKYESGLKMALDEITSQKKKIEVIFDNIHSGVLMADQKRCLDSEYSKRIEEIFENSEIEGQDVVSFIFADSTATPDQISSLENTLVNSMDEDELNWELNKSHLIKETSIFVKGQEKYLNLSWSPVILDEKVSKMIVSIEDVTEEKRNTLLRMEENRINEFAQSLTASILKLGIDSAKIYLQDLNDLKDLLVEPIGSLESRQDVLNRLHTLKGETRLLNDNKLASAIHDIETVLLAEKSSATELSEAMEPFLDCVDGLTMASNKLFPILNEGENQNWSLFQVISLLRGKIDDQISKTDSNLTVGRICLDEAATEWPVAYRKPLQNMLSHAFQNAIDHGYLRPKLASPIEIFVTTETTNEGYHLTVSDRGAGINMDFIEDRLKTLEPSVQATLKQPTDLLFLNEQSSASDVSQTSGRGIGLTAIKTEVENLNGDVSINNNADKSGTTLSIKLPIIEAKKSSPISA